MCTILSFADFVYATPEAFFITPFTATRLAPEGLSTIKFAELMGPRRANLMLMLDKKLMAKEAAEWGLITGVIPLDGPSGSPPSYDSLFTEAHKLPQMRFILGSDLRTLCNSKALIQRSTDVQRYKEANRREMNNVYDGWMSAGWLEWVKKQYGG